MLGADSSNPAAKGNANLNRVSTVAEPFGLSLTFTWDALGRRTKVEDSLGGVATSTYNVLGQLTKREFGGSGQTPLRIDLTYTVEGQQESLTRYSDLAGTTKVATTSYTYDAAQRLSNLHHFDGSNNNIANYTYTFDAHSRLTNINRNGTVTTYTYDDTDQVTGDGTATFTYDAEGNRTNTGYTTGTGNQLNSDGIWNYTYDDEGNMTKKVKISDGKTWTYSYDHRNQITQVQRRTTDGGTLELDVDFKYDAYGNRLEKTIDSNGDGTVDTTERYALDGWNAAKPSPIGTENWDVFADLDGNNNLQTRYLRGDIVDQLFVRTAANGDAFWYFTDHLGSIRDITDNTGVVKDTLSYDAFGNILSESDATYGGRYKWTGREIDQEIELQYNRARYYDAKIGRWISQDPLGFDAGDSNLYRYVRNAPILNTDPTGFFRLQMIYKPLGVNKIFNKDLVYHHAFLLLTDNVQGSETFGKIWLIRGGPEINWTPEKGGGLLIGTRGYYQQGIADWNPNWKNWPSETFYENNDPFRKTAWDLFKIEKMIDKKFIYDPVSKNSNAYVFEILRYFSAMRFQEYGEKIITHMLTCPRIFMGIKKDGFLSIEFLDFSLDFLNFIEARTVYNRVTDPNYLPPVFAPGWNVELIKKLK